MPGLPKCPTQSAVVGCVSHPRLQESFWAQLNGLAVGKKYKITFYESNCGWAPSYVGKTCQWEVVLGKSRTKTTKLDISSKKWVETSVELVASTATARFEMLASGGVGAGCNMCVCDIRFERTDVDPSKGCPAPDKKEKAVSKYHPLTI